MGVLNVFPATQDRQTRIRLVATRTRRTMRASPTAARSWQQPPQKQQLAAETASRPLFLPRLPSGPVFPSGSPLPLHVSTALPGPIRPLPNQPAAASGSPAHPSGSQWLPVLAMQFHSLPVHHPQPLSPLHASDPTWPHTKNGSRLHAMSTLLELDACLHDISSPHIAPKTHHCIASLIFRQMTAPSIYTESSSFLNFNHASHNIR